MGFYANNVHPIPPDRHADDCDDQLPLISHVGRGVKGDSGRLEVKNGRVDTHLVGGFVDNADGTFHTEWISDNINGGELRYQYNLNPFTIPRTFTITFIYTRGHEGDDNFADWSWTSPAIPYIWRVVDEDGNEHEQPDHIVGSGVATIFAKTVHDEWDIAAHEKLHYPIDSTTGEPFDRSYFNSPEPEQPWSATITFGHGGDIDVPDFDDIAKIIGVTKEDIYNILEDNSVTINGIEASNLIEYIDKCDARDLEHVHKDLGFNDPDHNENGSFGPHPLTEDSYDTVKEYVDAGDQFIYDLITAPGGINQKINNIYNILQQLVSAVYGASLQDTEDEPPVTDSMKKIVLPNGVKIPTGNINVFSGDTTHYIRTRDGEANDDLKGV